MHQGLQQGTALVHRRALIVFGLASLTVSGWATVPRAQNAAPLRFAISFPAERSAQPLDGRVLLFISDDGRSEPRTQTDQYRANSTRPIFGVDVDALKPGQDVIIDDKVVGWPARSLKDIPPGDYWVQALFNRYETFHRSDGHTVKMPMDQGEGQKWAWKPGNFFSKPVKLRVDPTSSGEIKISMDLQIPPIEPPKDTKQVKYIRVQNDRLTKFWGRPMHLGAIVLLPYGWETHPDAHYPLLVHHGHFPGSMANDGWRETPPDAAAKGPERRQQEAAYQFYKDWNGPKFPRMIHLLVQHPTPYFDDSYAVNSANNGPYGDAITYDSDPADREAVPRDRPGLGARDHRRVDRRVGSVRRAGDVPGLVQRRVGALSRPGGFQFLSIGEYLRRAQRLLLRRQPVEGARRSRAIATTAIICTRRSRIAISWSLRSARHGRSGGQHDAWASVFGPVGDDGYYKPLYDKVTGAIDPEVAQYWRDNYDLRHILQRDWAKLGPKLRGKIHITSGTMDNGYLNNAVYQMEEFLMRATPSSESEIIYGERREHCFTGDTEHSNTVGSRTVHQRYMPAMARWMIKTAPAGSDTKSWVS